MGKLLFKGGVQHRQRPRCLLQDTGDFPRVKLRLLEIHISCQQFGGRIQIIGKEAARQLDFVRIFLQIGKDPGPGSA